MSVRRICRRPLVIGGLLAGFAMAGPAGAETAQNKLDAVPPAGPVDLILTGGQVRTPTGWAEAVAIRDGVIVAVGNAGEVGALASEKTAVEKLDGKTVLPGLHDMHVHAQYGGMEQYRCHFAPGAAPDVIVAAVAACVADAAPGDWVIGGNWVGAVFAPGEQTRQLLDTVSPDNPVMLQDESHHTLWVNTLALQIAGITHETPDPDGGLFDRDETGMPTGVLRETARELVRAHVPPDSLELRVKALTLATNQMLAYGITSFMEASLRAPNIVTYRELGSRGILKQRVRGCIVTLARSVGGDEFIARRAEFAAGRFQPDCVKIFTDGVPTESHTGAMLDPYADVHGPHDHRPEKGMLMIPQDDLNAQVAAYDAQGLHIKFHSTGDAAVRATLDAVEYARRVNGWGGPMHHVGHNSFVDPADIPRVRDLHMTWEFSPYIWYPTPISAVDIVKAVGPERMTRFIPIRDALESGANVVVGSDWSVVPSVNPWLALETLVTRQKPGAKGDVLAGGQRITLEQAFDIMTDNAAQLMGHRDKVGAIEVGLEADLIVTRNNPFTVPLGEVHNTNVLQTYIAGEKVFDAANPPPLTAH